MVVHGKRSLKPLLLLLFLSPLVIIFTRTEIACARSLDACVAHTTGVLGGTRKVVLSRVATVEIEDDRGMTRPAFVMRDGSRVAVSAHIDAFEKDEKIAVAQDLKRYLGDGSETFDEGYGPSPVLVALALVVVGGLATLVLSRDRARIVLNPVTDVTEVTFHPKFKSSNRTTLEHVQVRAEGRKVILFDTTGAQTELPFGTNATALREWLGAVR